jgi:predicted transposase YdaD
MAEGEARGEARGKVEGKAEGKEEIIEILLKQRFSTLPAGITARLDGLTTDQMNELAAALLSFSSLADLEKWLGTHSDSDR